MKGTSLKTTQTFFFACAALTLALVFSHCPAKAVTIDTVPIGNAGNAPDQLYDYQNPNTLLFGGVPYNYRIGTTEVTNAQYAEFLNAKAASDPLALYNTDMGSNARGGVTRSGVDGSFTYATRANMADKPVNFVSWYDSIRFANWLNNGQGAGSTETGAYTLGRLLANGAPANQAGITRNVGATWFLTSENEWYKAAYHQPAAQGGDADNYWLYPTRSNSVPTVATANSVGDISNPGANVANNQNGAIWNGVLDGFGNVTTVGSAGPLDQSFYGTSDQGGNVWEWNEASIFGGRSVRGGGWSDSNVGANHLAASFRGSQDPAIEPNSFGFRVATVATAVPEPSGFVLAALGLIGLVVWRLRLIRPQIILPLFAFHLVPIASAHAATIGDLAAEVSTSNLQSHVTALEGDRRSVAGRDAARSYIGGQLQGYGYTTSVDATGNIVAELTGITTPSEIYVVGAHFDAVSGALGADDNASGIAGMLEVARIFSTRSFNSTIRFIGFDQEESGDIGSDAYAQNAAAAGDNIALATIFEMIGYTSATQTLLPTGDAGPFGSFAVSEDRTVGDFIGALAANDPQLLADYVNAAGLYAPSLPVVTGLLSGDVTNPTTRNLFHNLYRSDHVGFWLNGYDALLLSDTANFRNPNYHTANDLSSTLNYPFMTQVVRGTVGLVADRAGLVAVPEPSSFVLAALGLIGLTAWGRRRKR
jgi:formylglycine-generating enzyme required for sulfatase activity